MVFENRDDYLVLVGHAQVIDSLRKAILVEDRPLLVKMQDDVEVRQEGERPSFLLTKGYKGAFERGADIADHDVFCKREFFCF